MKEVAIPGSSAAVSKWRWRGRNRAELQATLQSRRLFTVDRFWILWPRFWHRPPPCPPFHYRRVSGRPASRQIVAKAVNSSVHPFLIFCRPLPWWWRLRLVHLMTVRSRLPFGWFLPKGSTRLEAQRRLIQLYNYMQNIHMTSEKSCVSLILKPPSSRDFLFFLPCSCWYSSPTVLCFAI
jgi:hypothetical protein